LPPGEIISFEETLTNDGGLLEWISQKEHLVPAIAQLKMEKYLEEFRQQLKKGEPVIIPGVGKLLANAVGRVSFEQEPLELSRDVLHVSPVIRQDASHKVTVGTKEMINNQVVDHLTASPSSSSSSTPSESKTPPATPAVPAAVTSKPADYEYEGFAEEMPSKLRWLWVAIPAACVLTAVIVWYSVNKNRPEITRAESAVVPTPAEAVPVVPETQATADSAAQAAAATEAQSGMLDYFIVIQTFKTGKAAEKMLKKRQGYGLKDLQLISNADSSFVRLGEHFRTLPADTTAMKDSIRKKYQEPVRLEIKQP